ncbi:MAG: hypothetical protein ABIH28_00025, partial [archaeon]
MIKTNKKARIAIFQIVNLVLSIIAFGFIIGMVSVEEVSGDITYWYNDGKFGYSNNFKDMPSGAHELSESQWFSSLEASKTPPTSPTPVSLGTSSSTEGVKLATDSLTTLSSGPIKTQEGFFKLTPAKQFETKGASWWDPDISGIKVENNNLMGQRMGVVGKSDIYDLSSSTFPELEKAGIIKQTGFYDTASNFYSLDSKISTEAFGKLSQTEKDLYSPIGGLDGYYKKGTIDSAKHALGSDGKVYEINQGALQTTQGTGTIVGDFWLQHGWFGGVGAANFVGHIVSGLGWSVAVVGVIQMIGGLAGWKKETKTALSWGAFAGIMAGKGTYGLVKPGGWLSSGGLNWWKPGQEVLWMGPMGWSIFAGGITAVLVFQFLYEETSKKIVTFNCYGWQAPVGGGGCEECNSKFYPCSEYRCKSLGQACGIVNKGTDQEKCVWLNPKDVSSPTIQPWEFPLTKDHVYSPNNAIRPPD